MYRMKSEVMIMSFTARRRITDSIDDTIEAKDINASEINNNFFCPCCNCIFRYRSYASNQKAAHFFKLKSSNHDSECCFPFADSIQGDVSWESANGFDIDLFFKDIVNTDTRIGKGSTYSNNGTANNSTCHLSSVRLLYKFCMHHNNNSQLGNVKVQDVLVARKTAYLYTRYIRGIRLVECKYRRYDSTSKSIFLSYPFSHFCSSYQINIRIDFSSTDLYMSTRYTLFNNPTKTVLILSNWKTENFVAYCTISNKHQIVLI